MFPQILLCASKCDNNFSAKSLRGQVFTYTNTVITHPSTCFVHVTDKTPLEINIIIIKAVM